MASYSSTSVASLTVALSPMMKSRRFKLPPVRADAGTSPSPSPSRSNLLEKDERVEASRRRLMATSASEPLIRSKGTKVKRLKSLVGSQSSKKKLASSFKKSKRYIEAKRRREEQEKMDMEKIKDSIRKKNERITRLANKTERRKLFKAWAPKYVAGLMAVKLNVALNEAKINARKRHNKDNASNCIQRSWKKKYYWRMAQRFRHAAHILRKYEWKAKLNLKCSQRRNAAERLRHFVRDYASQGEFASVMKKYRWKVIKAQRFARGFLLCRRARLIALGKMWERLEERHGKSLKIQIKKEIEDSKSIEQKAIEDARKEDADIRQRMRTLHEKTLEIVQRGQKKIEVATKNGGRIKSRKKKIRDSGTIPLAVRHQLLLDILVRHRTEFRLKEKGSSSGQKLDLDDMRELMRTGDQDILLKGHGHHRLHPFHLYTKVDEEEILSLLRRAMKQQILEKDAAAREAGFA